jgi:hypothetical protein
VIAVGDLSEPALGLQAIAASCDASRYVSLQVDAIMNAAMQRSAESLCAFEREPDWHARFQEG